MTEFLTSHWLILNVLIPLVCACFISMTFSIYNSLKIFMSVPPILLILAIFAPNKGSNYALGGWFQPVGIEYILDDLNFPFVIYLHIILLLFTFNLSWIRLDAERSIAKNYRHLLYAILMAAHTGFVGIVVTGDIFNLYVFIEIASLASYALISIGKNKFASHAAFEYLIIGTIGTTLILIGIGMIFSATGALNMNYINSMLSGNILLSRMVYMGILFFIVGILVKIALFPLHFWMIRAYNYTSGVILIYIASVSGVVGFYILLRFIYTVIGIEIFEKLGIDFIINLLGIMAIIYGAYVAYRSEKLRDFVLFSSVTQIGYICMMIATKTSPLLCAQYIMADGFIKFVLFYFITQVEIGRNSIQLNDLIGMKYKYPIMSAIITFNLISNMGLPITIGFFNKINLLYSLMNNVNIIGFIIVILVSLIGVEYNFKIIKILYSGSRSSSIKLYCTNNMLALIAATILGFGLIFL